MTLLGKGLVFATLVLSILMAGWAVGLYTQRVDWNTAQVGEVPRRAQRIRDLWGALVVAEARWKGGRADVAAREAQRPANQAWYAQELAKMQNSPKGQPLQAVVYDAKGAVVLQRPFGLPKTQPAKDWANQDLYSLDVYTQERVATRTAIDEARAQIDALVKENKKLTDELVGDKARKGLRERLAYEQEKLVQVKEELEYLKNLASNAEVDSERLLRRQKQLEERVAELSAP